MEGEAKEPGRIENENESGIRKVWESLISRRLCILSAIVVRIAIPTEHRIE